MATRRDSLAHYILRISEMIESIKIIQQAPEEIPGGPYENLETQRFDILKDPERNDLNISLLVKSLFQILNCRNRNFM